MHEYVKWTKIELTALSVFEYLDIYEIQNQADNVGNKIQQISTKLNVSNAWKCLRLTLSHMHTSTLKLMRIIKQKKWQEEKQKIVEIQRKQRAAKI